MLSPLNWHPEIAGYWAHGLGCGLGSVKDEAAYLMLWEYRRWV